MTTLTRTTIASVILAFAVAACGGGSGGVTPSAPGKTISSDGLTASAVFVVKVPHESTTTSSARKPQYLTPQVQGIDFSVYANDGSAVNNRGYVFYALTPQSTYCTNSQSALTCTLDVQAYPGNDYFQVNTYDGDNPTTPGSNGTSRVVSTGAVTATIMPGVLNTISVVTNGVVDQFAIAPFGSPVIPASTTVTTQNVDLIATDADDNIIIGNYDQPISLADSDASGATTLSTTAIPSSGTVATLTYNGTGGNVTANVTASTNDPVDSTVNYGPRFQISQANFCVGCGPVVVSTPTYLLFGHANAAAQTFTLGGTGTVAPFHVSQTDCTLRTTPLTAQTTDGTTFSVTPNGSPQMCRLEFEDANNVPGSMIVLVSP